MRFDFYKNKYIITNKMMSIKQKYTLFKECT